ncbi:arginine-tRNA-protein transferase [Russula earlei]|uniref:Arginine-tRNA-protein transferase n=1 Tax=Russula earlei TaxID=71964 RepID=A0ACC0UNF3_9AGAM|nr:arginine-tRNA-protein transferase [Russula earlei]
MPSHPITTLALLCFCRAPCLSLLPCCPVEDIARSLGSEQDMSTVPTIVEPHLPYNSSCGYCKGTGEMSFFATSLTAYRMSCSVYQGMIDRGWRRSGLFCYKPDLKRSCCPEYTIKCVFRNSRFRSRAERSTRPNSRRRRVNESLLIGAFLHAHCLPSSRCTAAQYTVRRCALDTRVGKIGG